MLKFYNFNIRSKSEVDTSLANAGPLAIGLRLDVSAPNDGENQREYHLR